MTRLAVPIVILLLMLLGGVAWHLYGFLDFGPAGREEAAETPSAETKAEAPAAKAKSAKHSPAEQKSGDQGTSKKGSTDAARGSFDVARIDPNGTSVFAGRAEPGASVTIMGDGKAVGTTKADENGEWTFVTEHRFASADPEIGLVVGRASQSQEEVSNKAETGDETIAQSEAVAQREAPGPQSAGAVTSRLLRNLEGMVESARIAAQKREEAAEATEAAEVPEAETANNAAPRRVATARVTPPLQPSADAPAVRNSVPVPITFVFNEATFTQEGQRAVALLLEYLQLKRYPKISLTGHADERGTEALNMSLSRERLETVARYLRDGGYPGKLELIPKGESEPFAGVARSQYNQEDLWQLDRRVELNITP